jgi:WD40 repeat protein
MTKASYWVIQASALHIYKSVLPFLPSKTSLYANYKHQVGSSVNVLEGKGEFWPRPQSTFDRTMEERLLDPVHVLEFSPNGERIFSGSRYGVVTIRDGITGSIVRSIEAHDLEVLSIASTTDGKWFATGSADYTVKIWHMGTGSCHKTLEGHKDEVTAVCFTEHGERLASGSEDGIVCIWNATDGAHLFTLKGHQSKVRSIAFTADARYLISRDTIGDICVWDATLGIIVPTPQPTVGDSPPVTTGMRVRLSKLVYDWSPEFDSAFLWEPDGLFQSMMFSDGLKGMVVYGKNNKLVCWLPAKPNRDACYGSKMAVIMQDGKFYLLDFSELEL